MPQLLPIAVTNTSENREILKTFGIDASYTLPVVAVRGHLANDPV